MLRTCCSALQTATVFTSRSSKVSARRVRLAGQTAAAPAMHVYDRICPNDEEKKIFATLKKAQSSAPKTVQLRCAGGWVRDKLLGRDSKDIDIALDTMLGEEFGRLLLPILELEDGIGAKNVVIKSNPDQSKHLETATIRVHNIDIDLVNLRSETYADGSRIPTQTFGTPKQDAMRRDLTINALFYNLETEEVEDLTERGLDDLRAGIIRTPLDPCDTFLDDPLRVLRAIRFATRFGFALDPQLQEAAVLPEVREALAAKVSRERFSSEMKACINGPGPVESIEMAVRLKVFPVVFAVPGTTVLPESHAASCLACMRAAAALLDDWHPEEPLSASERELALLSALLLPLRGPSSGDTTDSGRTSAKKGRGPKGCPPSMAASVLRVSVPGLLKNGSSKMDTIYAAVGNLSEINRTLQAAGDAASSAEVRSKLGVTIQGLKQDLWRPALATASLLSLPEAAALGSDAPRDEAMEGSTSPDALHSDSGHNNRLSCLKSLETAALAFKVDRAWEIKPKIDGKVMGTEFGLKGPLMGVMTKELMRWQLGHPDASVDDARSWLRARIDKQTQ